MSTTDLPEETNFKLKGDTMARRKVKGGGGALAKNTTGATLASSGQHHIAQLPGQDACPNCHGGPTPSVTHDSSGGGSPPSPPPPNSCSEVEACIGIASTLPTRNCCGCIYKKTDSAMTRFSHMLAFASILITAVGVFSITMGVYGYFTYGDIVTKIKMIEPAINEIQPKIAIIQKTSEDVKK